jgi:hypothetical protein
MPRSERGRASKHRALLIALCGLACVAAVAMAICAWRAAIDPVAPIAAQGPGARARSPVGEAPTPPFASPRTPADGTLAPPQPSRRHHRGNRAPAELAAVPLESLGAQLTAELSAVRPRLEACTRAAGADDSTTPAEAAAAIREVQQSALRANEPSLSVAQEALLRDLGASAIAASHEATPRSLRLDVETGDGEVRIVGVPALDDGSAFHRCAEQELRGKTVASPGATAGRRISVVLPL